MLVLARRVHERILIPSVRTAVEVTAIKPGFVRLGIDAPPEVTVLREEVYLRDRSASATLPPAAGAEARHGWRNRLNSLTLDLALLRQQLPAGPSGPGAALLRMEAEVQDLCQQLWGVLEGEPAATAGHDRGCRPALTVDAATAARG